MPNRLCENCLQHALQYGRTVAWLLLAAAFASPRPIRADDYRVGVGRIDVTPDFPVRLNGFRSRRADGEATEVSQRIWAKALVIDDGKPVVLVALDNCGITAEHTRELARRLEEKAGLPRERVALTVTHTHSAPMLRGVLPNMFGEPIPPEDQAHVDRYTEQLLDKLEQVSLDALADRRPAHLVGGRQFGLEHQSSRSERSGRSRPAGAGGPRPQRRDPRHLYELCLPLCDAQSEQDQRRLGRLRSGVDREIAPGRDGPGFGRLWCRSAICAPA